MPTVEIVSVGTELLLGQLVDTNAPHIAAALAAIGVDVFATHAVGDNRGRIAAAIRSALERADGVITTGGLGPTIDDLTKEAVCDALGVDAELDESALRAMEGVFAASGRTMRENNRKQAFLPKGARMLPNPIGTAPGFIAFNERGGFVASMPGVPGEMKPMLAESVIPWLRGRFDLSAAIHTRVLHTVDIAESEIDHRIDDLFRSLENPKIAVLAHGHRVDVKIMAKASSDDEARSLVAPVERDVLARLAGHVYGVDEMTLPGAVLAALAQLERTVAVAESCTGGSIAAQLTSVAGASKSFMGGVVAYDNHVKTQLLGVDPAVLARTGAVSEETAAAMAQGVCGSLGADMGLATTGIAGPEGGTPEKPVGLVWLALAEERGTRTQRLMLRGDRQAIQARATVAALALLWRSLERRERIGA